MGLFFVLVNSSQLGLIAEIWVVKVCPWSFPEVENLELLALQKALIFLFLFAVSGGVEASLDSALIEDLDKICLSYLFLGSADLNLSAVTLRLGG
jgi:hypothetical protein